MAPGAGVGQVAGPGQTPGTDMTSISFRDQLWLNSFPLDCALVFDYFALSPFYDRTCSNEQLRMRSIYPLDAANLKSVHSIILLRHFHRLPRNLESLETVIVHILNQHMEIRFIYVECKHRRFLGSFRSGDACLC